MTPPGSINALAIIRGWRPGTALPPANFPQPSGLKAGGERLIRFRHLWGKNKRAELVESLNQPAEKLYEKLTPHVAVGLPFLLAGLWSGFKLYGTIDDEMFRKVVLILILLAGLSLIVPAVLAKQ